MSRIKELEKKVGQLYEQQHPDRADWADWLYNHHVPVVADYATQLAKQFKADPELSRAAALLHDIADVFMKRRGPRHEQESLRTARKLLLGTDFSDKEIKVIVDDAIKYHSCHDGQFPKSLEGKVLSTADAMAHFKTDFYSYATSMLGSSLSPAEIKAWVLKKIKHDYKDKIFFDSVRKEVKPEFDLIKKLYSR